MSESPGGHAPWVDDSAQPRRLASRRAVRPNTRLAVASAVVLLVGAAGCESIANLHGPEDEVDPKTKSDPATPDVDAGSVRSGGITVSPATMDFGEVACGTTAPARTLRLENEGATAQAYQVLLPADAPFKIVGDGAGTVKAGEVVKLTVSATPPGPRNASADLSVEIGGTSITIPLQASGIGGALEVTPTNVDFGELRADNAEGSPFAIALQNPGNRALSIESAKASSANFRIELPSGPSLPTTVAAGQTVMAKAILVDGTPGPILTGTATFDAPQACGKSPSVSLRGRRVDAKMTVSPGTVAFGDVGCKQGPAKSQLVISNYDTTSPLNYEFTPLAPGSWFVLGSEVTGLVAQAPSSSTPSTATIVVSTKSVDQPGAPVTETLHVTLRGNEQIAKDIPLTMRPAGAIITADPLDLAYSVFPSKTKFRLTNGGNVAVTLSYQGDQDFYWTKGQLAVDPGKSSDLEAKLYKFDNDKTYKGTITLTKASGGPLCADLPTLTVHKD